MEKSVINLQDELTSLIVKKQTIPNLQNIDKLIDNKRDEITKILELNISNNGKSN